MQRDFGVVIGCIIGGWLIISLVSQFNSTGQQSAGALETAHLRADAAAAQAQVEKLKSELKKAVAANQTLTKRVGELERQLKASPAAPRPATNSKNAGSNAAKQSTMTQ